MKPTEQQIERVARAIEDEEERLVYIDSLTDSEWQPISTAPKDKDLQLYCKDTQEQFVGQWMQCLEDDHEMFVTARCISDDGESITVGCKPTHWMPLPNPPPNPDKP